MQRSTELTEALQQLGLFSAVRAHVALLEDAISRIHTVLDGKEWDSVTLGEIAIILEGLSLPIREPDDADVPPHQDEEGLRHVTYTAFCHDTNGTGTVWIDKVSVLHRPSENGQAIELKEAENAARRECAHDWNREDEHGNPDVSEIHCMGLATGDINLELWDDTHLEN